MDHQLQLITDGRLRISEKHTLSNASVRDPSHDNFCAYNGFVTSQQRTDGGLDSSSHKGFVSAPLCSTLCVHAPGSCRQTGASSRTKASTPDFKDY